MVDKVHVYMCLHIALIKSTARNKTRIFLVCSSFLLAGSSFWPKRSGTTMSPLVVLLSAVLLRRMKWVAT